MATKSPIEEFLDQSPVDLLFSTFLTLHKKAGLIEIDLPVVSYDNAGRLTIGAIDDAMKRSGQDLTWYAHDLHMACGLS